MFERLDQVNDDLHVVTTVFNPYRYRSRWKLYEDFARMCFCSGAKLYTCEIAYGERDFVLSPPEGDPSRLLQLRTFEDLWLKENALRLMMERLPLSAKYIAWVDADINFMRPDWVNETLHLLQRYHVIQMWSQAFDLDSNHQVIQEHHSFMSSWTQNLPPPPDPYYYYTFKRSAKKKIYTHHPGFAWAATKEALDHLGGLLDFGILGAGDNHMAQALVGNVHKSCHPQMGDSYKELLNDWQGRALLHLKKDVGFMEGALYHAWHGKKADRKYKDRWKILVENQFNPNTDLKRDMYGLHILDVDTSDRMIKLRDDIRAYFKNRNEDHLSE